MDERTVVITEKDGTYQIQNNGMTEFALLGILECIVFDMKTANRQISAIEQKRPSAPQRKSIPAQNEKPDDTSVEKSDKKKLPLELKDVELEAKEPGGEVPKQSATPDLRTRISNAVKAIRGLGAPIEDTDLSNLTDEELQAELEELTNQYKRLKTSKQK
jgi:hypothetical protein